MTEKDLSWYGVPLYPCTALALLHGQSLAVFSIASAWYSVCDEEIERVRQRPKHQRLSLWKMFPEHVPRDMPSCSLGADGSSKKQGSRVSLSGSKADAACKAAPNRPNPIPSMTPQVSCQSLQAPNVTVRINHPFPVKLFLLFSTSTRYQLHCIYRPLFLSTFLPRFRRSETPIHQPDRPATTIRNRLRTN